MSPYENELRIGKFFRTGLLATVRPGCLEPLKKLLATPPQDLQQCLQQQGIQNLSIFTRPLAGSDWCLVYFEYHGSEREEAAAALQRSSTWWDKVAEQIEPHRRAAKQGATWLRMEWMNHVGGAEAKPAVQVARSAVASRLKPEKELLYRTLHQTNWPGVSDQMSRSNIRHWTTFLTEIGSELYLFSYYEYLGKDLDADTAVMKDDPVTQRWWTHTEPCLDPLPEMAGRGSWADMEALLKVE